MQMRSQLRTPFMVPKSLLKNSQAFFAQQQEEANKLEAMKTKDTDRDGLSDYAETYLYNTSPYLSDSDSDGIADSLEIAQGTDPNCPKGKSCVQPLDQQVATGRSSSTLFGELGAVPQVPQAAAEVLVGASSSSISGVQAFVANPPAPSSMTPDQIRSYLVASGLVREDQISSLPDEQLIQVYEAAYQEALRVQAASKTPANSVPVPEPSFDQTQP